jgi:hypothetical protein
MIDAETNEPKGPASVSQSIGNRDFIGWDFNQLRRHLSGLASSAQRDAFLVPLRGRWVRTTGSVVEDVRIEPDTVVVLLSVGFFAVQAVVRNSAQQDKARILATDDHVTMEGRILGLLGPGTYGRITTSTGGLSLEDCELIES